MAIHLTKKRSKKAGLPPGTLVYIGDKKEEKVKITVIDYDADHFDERTVESIEDYFPFRDTPTVTWINIDGIHDIDLIGRIGEHFGLHPLIMEDIVNTTQRPKMEDLGDTIFIVLKMIRHDGKTSEEKMEQVSLILGKNFVLSFQEQEGDIFDPVRERARKGKGKLRSRGPDYLAYALIDAVVDNYFVILEKFGEKIESLEEELVADPKLATLQSLHNLKRGMIFLRKSVWPLREVISGLERGESSLIKDSTGIFLRDVYDHTIQVIDTVETYRDMLSGMLETYLSSISNRMNEVMKVLTIIATIFIPLTFIAGIYGMNFQFMPELDWRWSYFAVLAVMAGLALFMLFFFKRKRWL